MARKGQQLPSRNVRKDCAMATHLPIDPTLPAQAPALGGEKTTKAAADMARREFIARREQTKLPELFGSLEWSADFDYKYERTRN